MQIGASEGIDKGSKDEISRFIKSTAEGWEQPAHTLRRVLDFNRRGVKHYFTVQQKFHNHRNQIYDIVLHILH